MIGDPIQFRANVRARLDTFVGESATNVEIGVYNATIQYCTQHRILKKWTNEAFEELYCAKLRTVFFNLQRSEELRTRAKAEPDKIAFLSHQEMAPDKWMLLQEEKRKRDTYMLSQTLAATTDLFKCGKCKSRKCTYYQLQTRSADEPMTTFVVCVECEARWRC